MRRDGEGRQRFFPSSAAMSLVIRPTLRWAVVIWSRVTPQRFIQYSTDCRSDRSIRSLSMKPRLSFRPAVFAPLLDGQAYADAEPQ